MTLCLLDVEHLVCNTTKGIELPTAIPSSRLASVFLVLIKCIFRKTLKSPVCLCVRISPHPPLLPWYQTSPTKECDSAFARTYTARQAGAFRSTVSNLLQWRLEVNWGLPRPFIQFASSWRFCKGTIPSCSLHKCFFKAKQQLLLSYQNVTWAMFSCISVWQQASLPVAEFFSPVVNPSKLNEIKSKQLNTLPGLLWKQAPQSD